MKNRILLLIFFLLLGYHGFSQEIEPDMKPIIEVVSVDNEFMNFLDSIIDNSESKSSNCNKYQWYLHELNNDIVLTKAPMSSILYRDVLYDGYKGMALVYRGKEVFISIQSNSILNKKISKSGLYIDYNDFDSSNIDIPFYECEAYKLRVDKKTLKIEIVSKR